MVVKRFVHSEKNTAMAQTSDNSQELTEVLHRQVVNCLSIPKYDTNKIEPNVSLCNPIKIHLKDSSHAE